MPSVSLDYLMDLFCQSQASPPPGKNLLKSQYYGRLFQLHLFLKNLSCLGFRLPQSILSMLTLCGFHGLAINVLLCCYREVHGQPVCNLNRFFCKERAMIKLDFLKCLPKNIEGVKHWKSTHRSKGPNSLLQKHFYKSLCCGNFVAGKKTDISQELYLK